MLILYDVIYMNVFRTDYLVLNNQLVCSSLGKIISPTLSISELIVILRVGLRPPGLLPIYLSITIAFPGQFMFRQS